MAACVCGNVADNKEAQNVLQCYLNLYKNDYNESILDAFAANCIIDWFGVSIRSKQKLNEFLRYEVKAQLQHSDFNEAKTCEPIEVKPLHMTTKSMPQNKKQQLDSDTDDDDDEEAMETSADDSLSLGVAPLPADEGSNEAVDTNWLPKRPKRKQSQMNNKRCKTIDETQDAKDYSALKYIETRGRLLNLNATDFDRNVRLRISYRRHLTDASVQFVLIIYERLQANGEPQIMPRRKLNFDANEEYDEESDAARPTTPLNVTTDITEETSNLDAYLALRTPTKVSTEPPATPKRRRRNMSTLHLKRAYTAGPSFLGADPDTPRKPAKKCNAARTLRL